MAASIISRLNRPTIAVISIGAMGFGIASLLIHHSYTVVTNLDGRSEATKKRASTAGIKVLSLPELDLQSDIILSIVPPKDALALGETISYTVKTTLAMNLNKKITYIDMNAISPRLAAQICLLVTSPILTFVDGCILNFPPKVLNDGIWFKPALITSRPLAAAIPGSWTEELIQTLNIRHVNERIGAASGLKIKLGVLPELKEALKEQFPVVTEIFDDMTVKSQQKAYRWIGEMEEIRDTFANDGGWSRDIFEGVADVFRAVAEREKEGLEEHVEVDLFVNEVVKRMNRLRSKL